MDVLLENILTASFAIFGIAVFILLAYYIILYKIERDKNTVLELDITGLEHYNHMLKNKLQKKKELLTIQDSIIKDSGHDFKFDAIILKKAFTMENNHGIVEFQAPYNYEAITDLDTKKRVNVTVKYIN
jgi:hypothetical protein